MIKKIVFYLLCSLPVWLSAQYDAPLRIELECAKDQNDYHFIAADTNGLFVIYEGNDLSPDTTTWVFVHYDTNFQKIAHFIIPKRVAIGLLRARFNCKQRIAGRRNAPNCREDQRIRIGKLYGFIG